MGLMESSAVGEVLIIVAVAQFGVSRLILHLKCIKTRAVNV